MATKIDLAFTNPSSDGNAYPTTVDSTIRRLYHALSPTADGAWYFAGSVPEDYGSDAAFEVSVIANATTGVHRLGIDCAFVADGEDMDPTLTSLAVQGVTVPGTAYQRDVVTFSSGLPPAAPGDRIIGRVTRDGDGSGGTDSLAVPSLLDVVRFSYTPA